LASSIDATGKPSARSDDTRAYFCLRMAAEGKIERINKPPWTTAMCGHHGKSLVNHTPDRQLFSALPPWLAAAADKNKCKSHAE